MHGTPQTMQSMTMMIVKEMLFYFQRKLKGRSLGINDWLQIPVLAFKMDWTMRLMRKTELFKQLEVPLLVGISRSMIYKPLDINW
jgi:dihydropteroate synthase